MVILDINQIKEVFVAKNKFSVMVLAISISGQIHIFSKEFFQIPDAGDIAGEQYLILGFAYYINGQRMEATVAESRHRFVQCNPSSLRASIQVMEHLPLDTMVTPQDAETARESISNSVASQVRDCAGIQGLKMLRVSVLVKIIQEEFLRERRMSLMQNSVCVGATMAEGENEVCAICLDEMRAGEEVVCTPCVHRFHCACIGRWFETIGFCPLCRYKIE